MLHVLLLAGGSGTRLWPASRKAMPKHMLSLELEQSLLQTTFRRAANLVPPERIWIATSRSQSKQIADALPHFDTEHIWAEPVACNTAGSIGWAAVKLRHIDPDAVMVVLPADHVINPADIFCDTIRSAAEIVEQSPDQLITLGVKPTSPVTSYGYIERGAAWKPASHPTCNICAFQVQQFCEKPDREIAETFFQSGNFYWNAGIFVWKAEMILKLLKQFEPKVADPLEKIAFALGTPEENRQTEESFQKMKFISIDYAVLERAKNMMIVLESTFDWNDVGTWSALDRLYADQVDEKGNLSLSSPLLAVNSSGCIVRCDDAKHLIALVGVHNLVVIQTADATLIIPKDQDEAVRDVVEELKRQNLDTWI